MAPHPGRAGRVQVNGAAPGSACGHLEHQGLASPQSHLPGAQDGSCQRGERWHEGFRSSSRSS